MHTGTGRVVELVLQNGLRLARISCPKDMIPAPGQYLLAGFASGLDLLPVSLYSTEIALEGFITSSQTPVSWTPGTEITLRGPLGRGFELPPTARNVVLVQLAEAPMRLLGLIRPALAQGASVVLVSDSDGGSLPDDVEIQPLSALKETLVWGDYFAFDIEREKLSGLIESLGVAKQKLVGKDAQVLLYTPVPCGGLADCGICAVQLNSTWKMACKDGPVFDFWEI